MIIPVRCFTCNSIIGNRWEKYQQKMNELEESSPQIKTIIDAEFLQSKEINTNKPKKY